METEKYFIRDTNDDAGIYLEIPMTPPTTNKLWLAASQRNYARRLSKEAKAYNELVAAIVAGRRVPDDWETVVVKISVAPTARRGDVDNRIKAVLDSLTKAGFWLDDRIVSAVSCAFEAPCKQGLTRVLVKRGGDKFPAFVE